MSNKSYKGIINTTSIPDVPKGRDTFETPNYATDIIIPYIPDTVKTIWECASGGNKIVNRLRSYGYGVWATDIRFNPSLHDGNTNFVLDDFSDVPLDEIDAVITNPPFSLKKLFVQRAFTLDKPFAFLVSADYSSWNISLIEMGCEKIIPKSRISFITPNIITRVHEGEVWNNFVKPELIKEVGKDILNMKDYKKHYPSHWNRVMDEHKDFHNYKSKDEIPSELLYKHSRVQFHSMWLTYGFNIGITETFVDLPVKIRKENM